ncbi:50S ribosomal protein L10 [Candidatus Woesearchaeota archaeon]|nr:50S ribosomal protein L10 [Candidatus Woesearchaeota archaeon]
MKAHVAQYKKDNVKEFTKLLKDYPIIGTVNLENLPTAQLQQMRGQLRNAMVLKVTKRRFINIAIDNAAKDKPGLEKLKEHLPGMPALFFTKENPFKLYKIIQKSKSNAPAKAGQTAPRDITVQPGPTNFAPGPIISDLAGVGIKAGIENGKVAIKAESTIVKKGAIINEKQAGIMAKLGIEPMEIGLNVVAVYENGIIFTSDIMGVDETEYINKISQAASWAFNLAVEAGIMTKETTEHLIVKAFTEAKALAISQNIYGKDVIDQIVAKANNQMLALKTQLNL